MSRRSRSPLRQRERHPALLAAFALLVVATGLSFGLTEAGHVAAMQSGQFEAAIVDLRVDDGGERPVVVATAEVTNPSLRDVVIVSAEAKGRLGATTVVEEEPGRIEARVPGGATETVEFDLRIRPDHVDAVREAVAADDLSVSGIFWARIGEFRFSVGFETGDGAVLQDRGWSP